MRKKNLLRDKSKGFFRTKVIFVLLTAFFWLGGSSSSYSVPNKDGTYSSDELVAFAFYRLAEKTPIFEEWIDIEELAARREGIKDTKSLNKALEMEKFRLHQGFLNYDPNIDLIEFSAEMELSKTYSDMSDGEALPQLKASVPNTSTIYYSFYIGGLWIALVPTNSALIETISFDERHFQRTLESLNLFKGYEKKKSKVRADLIVRPVMVDASKMYHIDKMSVWIMMVDIAQVSLVSDKDPLPIWTYRAPWYQSSEERELGTLYGK